VASLDWTQQAQNIAHHFGNGKEAVQSDGSWMTLCPIHGDSTKPNLHVTPAKDRILLHCYACGDTNKQDLIKVVAADFQLSEKGTKAKQPDPLKKAERGRWINPIPSTAPARPADCYLGQKYGRRAPDLLWAYLNQNREVILFNARFNIVEEDGTTSKQYRRLALYYPAEGPEVPNWSWFGPDKSLPLYGLEQLTGNWWEKPVLLVEGEKAADEARKIFPEMVVIAFPGGANSFKHVDWNPLLGDKKLSVITLWPDNDTTGKTMAHDQTGIAGFLKDFGIRTRVVPVFNEVELPNKWDLADPLPEGWDRQNLIDLLNKADFSEVSDHIRVSRYCATLAGRPLNTEEFIKESGRTCMALEASAGSKCLQCPQRGRISKPADLTFIPDIQLDWVYLTRHKGFHNVRTQEALDHQGFNAHWSADPSYTLTGPTCATNILLASDLTSRAYDYGYMPNGPAVLVDNRGQRRLNVWSGFALDPETGAEPTPWLELGQYLVTDNFVLNHMYDWLAYLVQNPGKKINHGMLLISHTQGVGKDSFIEPIREIFGQGNCRDISSRSLDSAFNEYLLQTKLLIISELDTIGHRNSTYDYLKPLLAAPPTTLNVNVKGMKQIEIDNLIQVIAFSNKDIPVAIEDNDRRLLVYNIHHSVEQRWSPERFRSYYQWLKQGGAKQVFGWLMARDISAFDAASPAPSTEAKHELALAANGYFAQIYDRIRDGVPPFHVDVLAIEDVYGVLKDMSRGRMRETAFEQFLQSRNGGRLSKRVQINNRKMVLFACRHFSFWEAQSHETIRMAYKGGYYDMTSPTNKPIEAPAEEGPLGKFQF
jgi:hypothetical protein